MYIDDILIFGKSFTEALGNLVDVLTIIDQFGLQLKSSKCHLFRAEIAFLGHLVGRGGLRCDPQKISAVKNWQPPTSLRALREFLGFVGYYRRFVPQFASIAAPLVALTGKEVVYAWSAACQTAFERLRETLISAPLLHFP